MLAGILPIARHEECLIPMYDIGRQEQSILDAKAIGVSPLARRGQYRVCKTGPAREPPLGPCRIEAKASPPARYRDSEAKKKAGKTIRNRLITQDSPALI